MFDIVYAHTTDGTLETLVVDKLVSWSAAGNHENKGHFTKVHLVDGRSLVLDMDPRAFERLLRHSEE